MIYSIGKIDTDTPLIFYFSFYTIAITIQVLALVNNTGSTTKNEILMATFMVLKNQTFQLKINKIKGIVKAFSFHPTVNYTFHKILAFSIFK